MIDAFVEKFIQSLGALDRLDSFENLISCLIEEQIELAELFQLTADVKQSGAERRWHSIEQEHLMFRSSEDHAPTTADNTRAKDHYTHIYREKKNTINDSILHTNYSSDIYFENTQTTRLKTIELCSMTRLRFDLSDFELKTIQPFQ